LFILIITVTLFPFFRTTTILYLFKTRFIHERYSPYSFSAGLPRLEGIKTNPKPFPLFGVVSFGFSYTFGNIHFSCFDGNIEFV